MNREGAQRARLHAIWTSLICFRWTERPRGGRSPPWGSRVVQRVQFG